MSRGRILDSENEELDEITAEAVGVSVAASDEVQDVPDPLPVGGLWIHASRRTLHVGGGAAGKGPLVLAMLETRLGRSILEARRLASGGVRKMHHVPWAR